MRRLGRLLAVLAVLAALLVGAEFGVRALIGSEAPKLLAGTDLALEQPTVELAGGSVLLAVAQRRFVDVSGTARAAQLPFGKRRVPVRSLSYRASGIALVSAGEATIGTLAATGTMSWSGLSDIARLPVGYGGEGRLLVSYTADVLGRKAVKVGVSGVPSLDVANQRVELTQAQVEVAGVRLDKTRSQQLIDRVVKPIRLTADDRVRITAISVAKDGLVIDLTVTDLLVGR
ncbi:MAG: LmeA family phospholipid-binding protein [Micropruina sp.]|uniref:hypothetical protein n=1 Tax=Micropruina sp. TaxID=2737536 RepID=UPI0039E331CF